MYYLIHLRIEIRPPKRGPIIEPKPWTLLNTPQVSSCSDGSICPAIKVFQAGNKMPYIKPIKAATIQTTIILLTSERPK